MNAAGLAVSLALIAAKVQLCNNSSYFSNFYPHFPLPLHLCPSLLLLLPLLLVQRGSLAQRPAEHVDALRRWRCSLSAGRGCVWSGTGSRLSAPVPFSLPGFRPFLGPLLVSGPRPAPFLAVLAAFRVFGPGRASAPWAAHDEQLRGKLLCSSADMCTIRRSSTEPSVPKLASYKNRSNEPAETGLLSWKTHLKLYLILP